MTIKAKWNYIKPMGIIITAMMMILICCFVAAWILTTDSGWMLPVTIIYGLLPLTAIALLAQGLQVAYVISTTISNWHHVVNRQGSLPFAAEAAVIIKSAKGVPFFGGIASSISNLTSAAAVLSGNGLNGVILCPLHVRFSDPISIRVFPVMARLPGLLWVSKPISLLWTSILLVLSVVFSCANLALSIQSIQPATVLFEILKRSRFVFFTLATSFLHNKSTSGPLLNLSVTQSKRAKGAKPTIAHRHILSNYLTLGDSRIIA